VWRKRGSLFVVVGPRRRFAAALLGAGCLLLAGLASAAPVKNPWHDVTSPSQGAPRSIGDYSGGCVSGASALPLDGEGYHVVHPERHRNYGHPMLIDYLQTLGRAVHAKSLGSILIADLGQPRGGPAPSGHSSHQTGLDVDIWFWSPEGIKEQALTQSEREALKARSVLAGKSLNDNWTARTVEVLKMAASDPRVTRIFVSPIIKRELCEKTEGDRTWLGRLRPWYGHDDHYHVRLACPADSPDCTKQAAQASGDGCAELDWWFDEAAQADREKGKKQYQDKVVHHPGLPAQCAALLEEPGPKHRGKPAKREEPATASRKSDSAKPEPVISTAPALTPSGIAERVRGGASVASGSSEIPK
jgi:penicillin-insensitive murein endopeptidase